MDRIKNRLCLWAEYVSRDKLLVLVISLIVALMTFELSNLYTEIQRYNFILDISADLEDAYFYQLGNSVGGNYRDSEQLLDTLRGAEALNEVVALNYFSGTGATLDNGEWESLFSIYNISNSHRNTSSVFPTKLTDGTMIHSLEPNSILLDERAADDYSIGDTIALWVEYVSTAGDVHVEEKTIDVTVAGFVSEKELVIYTGRQPTDLASVYSTIRNPAHSIETMLISGYPSYYCLCSVLLDGDTCINFNDILPQMLILVPQKEATKEAVNDVLINSGLDPDKLVSYDTLKNNYLDNHSDNLRHVSVNFIVAVLCLAGVMLGTIIDWYTHKRNELAITVFCGATIKEGILLSAFPYLLSIFLGTVVGGAIWIIYSYLYLCETSFLNLTHYCVMFIAFSLIYLFGIYLYGFFVRKQSVVDIYRIRE